MLIRISIITGLILIATSTLFLRSERRLDRIPIRYTMYKYEKYDVFRRAAGKEFEKLWNRTHPKQKIQVFYEPIGGNYPVKLNTQVVAGTLQDLFFVPEYSAFVKQDVLLNLNPYIDANDDWDQIAEIYPKLTNALKVDNRLYGLPANLTTVVLYYNRGLFRKAGVAFPNDTWDWNTMLEVAKKLTVRDVQGRVVQFGLIMPPWYNLIPWNGARIWSDDGQRCVINSPPALEAFQFLIDTVTKHRVCPSPEVQERGEIGGIQAFETNRAAMMLAERYRTTSLWELSDVDWAVAPLPKSHAGLRRNRAAYNVIGINTKTRHPKIAYAFLKHLVSPKQIHQLVQLGDSIPMRWHPKYNEYFLNEPRSQPGENEAYLKGMEEAYSTYDLAVLHPDVPKSQVQLIGREIRDRCMLGQLSAEEGLNRIQQKLQFELNAYRQPVRTTSLIHYLVIGTLLVLTATTVGWLRHRTATPTEP